MVFDRVEGTKKKRPRTRARATEVMHVVLLGLVSLAALGGCSGETSPEDEIAEGQPAHPQDLDSIQQAIVAGWTAYTSEETSPVVCSGSSLVTGFGCSGKYCDNNRLYCYPTSATRTDTYWTSYFSEEGTNYRLCNSGYWMTGLACRGLYCDSVSLQCSRMANAYARNCYWTGWISDENGSQRFTPGYYARGAQCSGLYCDNMRFYVCQP